MNNILRKIELVERIALENNIVIEISNYDKNYIIAIIEWGDWKHDHARLDFLIKEKLNPCSMERVIFDEDGGDCYSAKHIYTFSS